MADVSVEFSFDEPKMQQMGIKKGDIYYTMKKKFSEKGLVCTADGDPLIFAGTGKNGDEAKLFSIIMPLIYSEWFLECASRCIFYKNSEWCDILANTPRAKEIVEYGMGGISAKYA